MINKFNVGEKVHCGVIVCIVDAIYYLQDVQRKYQCTMEELKDRFRVWNIKHPNWINAPVYRVYLNEPFVNPSFDDFIVRHQLEDIRDHQSLKSVYDAIKNTEHELMLPENEIQPYKEVEENKDNNEQKEDISL